MGYKDLLNSFDKKEESIEEAVNAWKSMSPAERAAKIQEIKISGSEEDKSRLLEIADMAKSNTQAGGTGTQTGDEILSKKEGTGENEWSDDNAQLSDKGKLAAAAGIGAGLGALNMAKKLRRTKSTKTEEGE